MDILPSVIHRMTRDEVRFSSCSAVAVTIVPTGSTSDFSISSDRPGGVRRRQGVRTFVRGRKQERLLPAQEPPLAGCRQEPHTPALRRRRYRPRAAFARTGEVPPGTKQHPGGALLPAPGGVGGREAEPVRIARPHLRRSHPPIARAGLGESRRVHQTPPREPGAYPPGARDR